MYKLIYVKGISRLDTWKFTTKQEQDTYFENLNGVEINEYYPPHYQNTIKLQLSDFDFTTQSANYLYIVYNNKKYYYFIDNINYINEEVYSIDITMDTIQTYMFNLTFDYANLNRRSIKRWNNDGTINRNYIRENLSQEDMYIDSYIKETPKYYMLFTSRKQMNSNVPCPTVGVNGVYTNNGLYYYLVPLLSDNYAVGYETSGIYTTINSGAKGDKFTSFEKYYDFFNKLSQSPNIIDCFFISSKYLDKKLFRTDINTEPAYSVWVNINTGTEGEVVRISNSLDFKIDGTNYYCVYTLTKIGEEFLNELYTLDYSKNTSIANNFNSKFIPQLIDENYIDIEFGEKTVYAVYPLYLLNEPKLYKQYSHDFICNNRVYRLSENLESNDKYNTTIYCNSDESYDMYTDYWQQYKSSNKTTLKNGIKSRVALEMGEGLIKSISTENPGGLVEGAINSTNILNEFRIIKGNLKNSPDTRNQGNQFSTDFLSNILDVYTRIWKVRDYETVAKKLEFYGYNVNEIIYNTNIFNLNDRYYYNVIGCETLDFELNCLSTEFVKEDIKSRFQNGIRLWNKSHNTDMIDNLQYDNVENDYIVEEE